jgi:hypothetical protein
VSGPLITSVKVETIGSHDHVRVWVRGQLTGTLIVSKGEGAALRRLMLATAEMQGDDVSWLVKDFHVLYRVAEAEAVQAHLDGYDTAHRRDLARQLARLAPAFERCEAVRDTVREAGE